MFLSKKFAAYLAMSLAMPSLMAENLEKSNPIDNESETEGYTFTVNTTKNQNKLLQTAKPSVRFGGYIVGKYSISDRSHQESNGGFDLR